MICGGGLSGGPLEEVVELGLELPELDVLAVAAEVHGLADEAHPRPGQATRHAVARARVLVVVQLEAASNKQHVFTSGG